MRRAICSVLALVITFSFAANASAVEKADALAGTKWKHLDPKNNEEMRFEFAQNGTFTFKVGETPETKGLYSIVDGTLQLKLIGRDAGGKIKVELIGVKLVRLEKERLVTELNNRQREFLRVR